jgi:branched-chain amino acid transport system substrate-binding protein/urea transport system substrate-binding protein
MEHASRRRFVQGGMVVGAAGLLGRRAMAEAETIKFGAVLEFSGGLELFGNQAKIGLDLAAKEINAAGGIKGRMVEILYEDNKTDPKTAVERTTKLIGKDRVIAIIGPIASNSRDAMTPTITRQKTPLLYATNYEGGACGRYIYCFNTVPNQELGKLVPFMAQTIGKSFYMFGADYVWPQKMFETAERLIADTGGQSVGKEFTPWGVKEFAPVIRRIQESGANVLLFALPGADGITFIRQAEDFGLLKQRKVGFLGFSEAYLGAFGQGKAQDLWVAVPLVASSTEPAVVDFVRRARAMTTPDTPISHYVLTHYNALKAAAAALDDAIEIGSEDLVRGLKDLTIQSPTGPVSIGAEDHHVTLSMYLAHTRGDTLQVFEALGEIAPESGCA